MTEETPPPEDRPRAPLLREGEEIRDTYVVEKLVGQGAFAEVYRVKHKFLGRQALKILRKPGMTGTEVSEMLKEAAILSKLGHPHIVRVFDANTVDVRGEERGYFTMEHVPTGTLEDFRTDRRHSPLAASKAVELMKQVLQGLEVAHGQNPPIVHRDLKPQNILIAIGESGPVAKISDFGLATQVDPLTLLTCPAGTLAYKSPEAMLDGGVDSIPSDIWSIGVILHQLLTGELPHQATGTWGWNSAETRKPSPRASDRNVEANDALDAIVMKCLEFEPHRRYASASALLGDLRRWKPSRATVMSTSTAWIDEASFRRGEDPSARALNPQGCELARRADALASEQRLEEAAQLAEEAISLEPALLRAYRPKIMLWKKGFSN